MFPCWGHRQERWRRGRGCLPPRLRAAVIFPAARLLQEAEMTKLREKAREGEETWGGRHTEPQQQAAALQPLNHQRSKICWTCFINRMRGIKNKRVIGCNFTFTDMQKQIHGALNSIQCWQTGESRASFTHTPGKWPQSSKVWPGHRITHPHMNKHAGRTRKIRLESKPKWTKAILQPLSRSFPLN